MNTQINFELVSPEEKLVSEPVHMVVIPGEEGEMGIGAHHASLVASLKPGVVALYKDSLDEQPRRIFIAGGFADVTGVTCTVLAEEAMDVSKLDAEQLQKNIRDLEEDLGLAAEMADKIRIESKLKLAKTKLNAATGRFDA